MRLIVKRKSINELGTEGKLKSKKRRFSLIEKQR